MQSINIVRRTKGVTIIRSAEGKLVRDSSSLACPRCQVANHIQHRRDVKVPIPDGRLICVTIVQYECLSCRFLWHNHDPEESKRRAIADALAHPRQKRKVELKGFVRKARASQLDKRDGHRCVRCGTTEQLTIDHIVPRAKGGKNEIENLQWLCHKCNQKKKDKISIG